MHSIRLPLNTCKVYFVVMANVLPPQKPQLTFDLKGATSNRQRVRGKALTELITGRRAASTFPTLLDKDWLHLSLRLQFTVTSEADALAATLAADSSFLASQGLMDYSLLLGIRTEAKAEEAKAEEAAAAEAAAEEAEAVADEHGHTRHYHLQDGGTAYIGLIDVLERWRGKWLLQSLLLRLLFRYVACGAWYNPDGITAIPPLDYAARFDEFVAVHVLGRPQLQAARGHGAMRSWQPFW